MCIYLQLDSICKVWSLHKVLLPQSIAQPKAVLQQEVTKATAATPAQQETSQQTRGIWGSSSLTFLFSRCSFAMAEEGKARQGLQRTPTDYFSQIPIYSPSLMLFESPTRPASRESMLNTPAAESLEREQHTPGTRVQPAQEIGPRSQMSRCHQHSRGARKHHPCSAEAVIEAGPPPWRLGKRGHHPGAQRTRGTARLRASLSCRGEKAGLRESDCKGLCEG